MKVVKLDWDTKKIKDIERNIWKMIQLRDWFYDIRILETKKGFHIYLELKQELSKEQVFALELLLNTDEFKMAIDLKRLVRGYKFWNVLFKMKYRKEKWSKETYTSRCFLIEKMFYSSRSKLSYREKLQFWLNKVF